MAELETIFPSLVLPFELIPLLCELTSKELMNCAYMEMSCCNLEFGRCTNEEFEELLNSVPIVLDPAIWERPKPWLLTLTRLTIHIAAVNQSHINLFLDSLWQIHSALNKLVTTGMTILC